MAHGVDDFFAKLSTDAALQAACSDAMREAGASAVVRLAAESGFTFTAEDLTQAAARQSRELDDQDLGKIAGGMNKSELVQMLSNR